jgi:hypothetical protein
MQNNQKTQKCKQIKKKKKRWRDKERFFLYQSLFSDGAREN